MVVRENKKIETSVTPPTFEWKIMQLLSLLSLLSPQSPPCLLLTNPHPAPWQSLLHWIFSMRTSRLPGIPIIPGVGGGSFACGMPSTPPMSSVLGLLAGHVLAASLRPCPSTVHRRFHSLRRTTSLHLPILPSSPNAERHCPRPQASPNHKYPTSPLDRGDKKDRWPVLTMFP